MNEDEEIPRFVLPPFKHEGKSRQKKSQDRFKIPREPVKSEHFYYKIIPYTQLKGTGSESLCTICPKTDCPYSIVTKTVANIGIPQTEKFMEKYGIIYAVTFCEGYLKSINSDSN